MALLSQDELKALGLRAFGENVRLSDKACIYNPGNIEIGDSVRIDDFTVLSAGEGGIRIGNFIHIGVYTSLIGAGAIVLEDFANISSKVAVYSSNDDYSGKSMTNPMIPAQYRSVTNADVLIGRHVIIGSGSVVLPGVTICPGISVGALSLVNRSLDRLGIYAGCPVRRVGDKSNHIFALERELLDSLKIARNCTPSEQSHEN